MNKELRTQPAPSTSHPTHTFNPRNDNNSSRSRSGYIHATHSNRTDMHRRFISTARTLASATKASGARQPIAVHPRCFYTSIKRALTRPMTIGHPRCYSTTPTAPPVFDHETFTQEFLSHVQGVPNATDPAQSSAILRQLVKTGVLKFTDMEDAPEKFFLAHRLLSTIGLGGFGVRFTVQFNLFAGSILGLASEEQRGMLAEIQEKGQLGCFLLTEMQAGVL